MSEIATLALHDALPILERRRELWGEGFRLYDILRLQTAPVRQETTEKFIDADGRSVTVRSEEHTSELQSRGQLVCRHVLEKKKINFMKNELKQAGTSAN